MGRGHGTVSYTHLDVYKRQSASCVLVVLGVYLEVALGVSAYGANFRSLGANNDVAAVTAFPNLNFALLENLSGFDVLQTVSYTHLFQLCPAV